MADNKGTQDMFSMYRDWVKTNEDAWNQMLNTTLGTEAFAEALGRAMDNYLLTQNTFIKAMRQYTEESLRAMNIATAADITRIAELVINLENKIDALADDLDDAAQTAALKGLSDRLASIERKLDNLVRANQAASSTAATGDQLIQIERKLDELTQASQATSSAAVTSDQVAALQHRLDEMVATSTPGSTTAGNGGGEPAASEDAGAGAARRRTATRKSGETA